MVQQSGEDVFSTGVLVEELMQQAKERVAEEFLAACDDDEEKRAMVLELCRKVLNRDQYDRIISAERSEEEEEDNEEGDNEEDEKDDDEHDESEESDEASSDDSILTMKQIEDKPYTDGISAETGELPFEEFKDLLEPDEDQQENQLEHSSRRGKKSLVPKKEAIHKFGELNATMLVNWHHHVKHSGQLYSDLWLDGQIRGKSMEKIEKHMLLMCLQDTRISKAVNSVLGKICEDLGLQSMVKKALEVWGVAENFPAVWTRKPTDQYTNNIRNCRQCEIFIARAYVCITTLKHQEVNNDFGNKLMSCFTLMEENLPRHLSKKRVRSRSTDSGKKGAPSSTSSSAEPVATNSSENTSTAQSRCSDRGISEQASLDTGKVADDLADKIEDEQNDRQTTSKTLDKTASTQPQQSEKSTSVTGGAESSTGLQPQGIHKDASGETGSDHVIEQVDRDTGEILGEFSSVEEIVKSIGHSLGSNPKKYIRRNLRGTTKSFSGFIWRYKGQTSNTKPDNRTGANGNGHIDSLFTTAQHDGKRKASDDAEVPPASKRTKPNLGDMGGQTADPKALGNQDSANEMQDVPRNACPRTMRAIAEMLDIKESPYLKEQNAEVGEEMFDYFKDLLVPRGAAGRQLDASQPAKDLFGEKKARQMVTVNNAIAKSGMVYGSAWKDGLIQQKNCGLISTYLLLLCLQEQRLASGSTNELGVVVSSLGVVEMVKDAVEAWKLGSDFPLFKGMKSPSSLHSKTKALLGCMIFVARSYRCMKVLKRNKVSDSIMTKVRKCLQLIHSSLEEKQARDTAQEQSIAERNSNKSEQAGAQKQKTTCRQNDQTKTVCHNKLVEGERSPEPLNPGFIMHDLFLKPARVGAESEKKKQKPIVGPKRSGNPQTPSSAAPSTTKKMEGKKSMGQKSVQKQPMKQPAHKSLQTKPRTHSQPASAPTQNARQTLNEPAQDSHLPTSLQKQMAPPASIQGTTESRPCSTHMEPNKPASTQSAPNNTPNPTRSVNHVPLEPILSPPDGDWYPPDEILNDTETELAYLTTECSHALRLDPSTISWSFIWEYASPLLKKELRESRETELQLHRLVRLHDGFVRKRFEFLKKNIQNDLNSCKRRPLMERIIPLLRRKSRLAQQGRSVGATA